MRIHKLHFCKVLFLFFVFEISSFGQNINRIEIPIPNNMEIFSIPIEEKGVIVLSQTSNNAFNLKKYDTELRSVRRKFWRAPGPLV